MQEWHLVFTPGITHYSELHQETAHNNGWPPFDSMMLTLSDENSELPSAPFILGFNV